MPSGNSRLRRILVPWFGQRRGSRGGSLTPLIRAAIRQAKRKAEKQRRKRKAKRERERARQLIKRMRRWGLRGLKIEDLALLEKRLKSTDLVAME